MKKKYTQLLVSFIALMTLSIVITYTYYPKEETVLHKNVSFAANYPSIKPYKLLSDTMENSTHKEVPINTTVATTNVVESEEVIPVPIPTVDITIPSGYTIEELSTYFEEQGISSKSTFLNLMNNKEYYNYLKNKYHVLPEINDDFYYLLEGYLLGGKYTLNESFQLKDLIEAQINNLQYTVDSLSTKFPGLSNYTNTDKIIIASILEKETHDYDDRRKIASVVYNRLKQDMKIQSDVTVQYVLDKYGKRVLRKDLEVESPYNTYFVDALPIGPIVNPSYESIVASFNPIKSTYLFFFGTGRTTYFSSTYEEHKKMMNKKS